MTPESVVFADAQAARPGYSSFPPAAITGFPYVLPARSPAVIGWCVGSARPPCRGVRAGWYRADAPGPRSELKTTTGSCGQQRSASIASVCTSSRVVNSTPEADGTYCRYFLRVPPTIGTARAAVAWTFGIDRVADYAIAVQS